MIPPAGAVEHPHAPLHLGKGRLVEEMPRVGGQGQVHGDEVRLGQEFVQGHGLDLHRLRPARGEVRIVGHDAHAESQGPPGHFAADSTQPNDPSVFRKSSTPEKLFRSHLPARIEPAACGTGRAPHSRCVKVGSAVAMVLPDGVFITITPRSVAAATSTLSTPTPARPTTLSFGAAASTAAVTLVSERTAIASTSPTKARSASGAEP